MSNVFIAFQTTEESRGIVEAIVDDNPTATITSASGRRCTARGGSRS